MGNNFLTGALVVFVLYTVFFIFHTRLQAAGKKKLGDGLEALDKLVASGTAATASTIRTHIAELRKKL